MTRLLTRHRLGLLAALVGNGLGQAAAAMGAALAVEHAFARLGSAPGPVHVVGVMVSLGAAGGLTAWLRARERVDAERLGQSYCHDLRLHLFARLTASSSHAIRHRSTGSVALRFVGDLTAVRNWVSLGFARLAVGLTMVVATIAAMVLIDPLLAVAVASATVLGTAGTIAMGPALREADREARRRRARLAGRVTEIVSTVAVVQASNAVDRERRRLRRQSERLRGAMIDRSRRLGALQAIAESTGAAATACLLLVALVTGLTAPEVAAAMTVVGLLIPQLRGLSRVQEYRQKQQVAVAAIRRFMDRPTLLTEPLGPRPLPPGPGRLRAHRLSIGIVDEVTVELPAGHTAAIVGPNGSGKSTLISAIARLVDLERGSVELDGTDLAEVSLADARSAIGISAPDLPLMRGSLRRNLTYRHPDAVPAELDWVIELCDLRPLIGSLPGGLDHRIEEGGTNLSSGQRQRLMLARALLGCPRLLLLDEADANLDAATTTIVDRVIAAHLGSCIVVTHRPERLAAADHVWHLDGGRLVEHGRTADLLAADSRTVALFAPDRRVSSDAHEQSPARCETRTRGLNAGR